VAGLELRNSSGAVTTVDAATGGSAWLARFRPDGSVAMAATIPGTASGGLDEIARIGDRVYLDLVIRGSDNVGAGVPLVANRKDGSLWAVDLQP
jgi:hypothetical protein